MVGLDRMAVGMDVDVAAGVENPTFVSRTNGSARSAALGTGRVVRTADSARVSRTRLRSRRRPRSREKILILENAGLHGQRRAYICWQKVDGEGARAAPKETQWPEEHCEAHRGNAELDQHADQARRGRGREGGGDTGKHPGVRKETLRVAYEEIKKLRADMVQEGESMDKNRSHVLFPESLEEVRNLELQAVCFRKATASKRMAGASGDATTEEIAWLWKRTRSRWISLKNEESRRGGRQGNHHGRQHVRQFAWLCVIVKV